MDWSLEVSQSAEADLALLFDHLIESYVSLGDSVSEAVPRARGRIAQILKDADRIATAPYRGERHDDLKPGVRSLTFGQAVIWFDPDEDRGVIVILAIFYGGQDARRRMLTRLLSG